jgi:hypothetical protein
MTRLPVATAALALNFCAPSGLAAPVSLYTFDVTVTSRIETYLTAGVVQTYLFPDPNFLGDSFQYTIDLNDWNSSGTAIGYKSEITFRSPYWSELDALNSTGLESEFIGSALNSSAYVDNDGIWGWDLLNGVPEGYLNFGSYDYTSYSQYFVDVEGFNNYKIFEHSEELFYFPGVSDDKIAFQATAIYQTYKSRYLPELESFEEYENEYRSVAYYGYASLRPAEVPLPGTLGLFGLGLVSMGLSRLRGSSRSR